MSVFKTLKFSSHVPDKLMVDLHPPNSRSVFSHLKLTLHTPSKQTKIHKNLKASAEVYLNYWVKKADDPVSVINILKVGIQRLYFYHF